MGKYKRLKDEHDKLKENFEKLRMALERNGSITTHKYYSSDNRSYYTGNHTHFIDKNRDNFKILLYNQGLLEDFLGIRLQHKQINEWKYVKRS